MPCTPWHKVACTAGYAPNPTKRKQQPRESSGTGQLKASERLSSGITQCQHGALHGALAWPPASSHPHSPQDRASSSASVAPRRCSDPAQGCRLGPATHREQPRSPRVGGRATVQRGGRLPRCAQHGSVPRAAPGATPEQPQKAKKKTECGCLTTGDNLTNGGTRLVSALGLEPPT